MENLHLGEFVATEKVHGANFSFITDGKNVTCCKRRSVLKDNDSFYKNWQRVLVHNKSRVLKAFQSVKALHPDVEKVIFYGELFGGLYPHPDVPKVEEIGHIQLGVWYAPDFEFYGFDIWAENHSYLSYDVACKIFEENGFVYNKELQRGTLEELLKFDVEKFESVVPIRLGFPKIANNFAEGIVIKPIENKYLAKGNRVIIKKKRSSFGEVDPSKKKAPKPIKLVVLAPEIQKFCEELDCYLTKTRLMGVVSKVGPPQTAKDIGKLIGMFAKDALEDFRKDVPAFCELKKSDQKQVTKRLNKHAAAIVLKLQGKLLHRTM